MRRALFAAALLATSASLALADGYAASQDSAKAAKATKVAKAEPVKARNADVVALARLVAVRRIRRCVALQGYRRERQLLRADHGKPAAVFRRNCMPVYATIVAKNLEQRIAGAQVLARHIRTIDFQRASFAQHQQTGRMVDLRIHQDDGTDCRVANSACRLQRGETFVLREQVRRSIEQNPVDPIGADCD